MRQLKISNELKTKRSDNIARYFNDVDRIKMLTPEEEWKLALKAQEGDERAVEKLVTANLRFVISVAKQYAPTADRLEELISQGNIGLVDAAKSFDPTRGFKFISYAVWHIRKEIMQYLNQNNRQIRLPQNINTDMAKVRKMQDVIFQKEGRMPHAVELLEESVERGYDFTHDRLKRIDDIISQRISPLENNEDPDGPSLIAAIKNENSRTDFAETMDMQTISTVLFSKLSSLELEIVRRRTGLHDGDAWSFSQIGENLEKSSETVRQIYKRSIKKIKVQAIQVPGLRQQIEELV